MGRRQWTAFLSYRISLMLLSPYNTIAGYTGVQKLLFMVIVVLLMFCHDTKFWCSDPLLAINRCSSCSLNCSHLFQCVLKKIQSSCCNVKWLHLRSNVIYDDLCKDGKFVRRRSAEGSWSERRCYLFTSVLSCSVTNLTSWCDVEAISNGRGLLNSCLFLPCYLHKPVVLYITASAVE